MPKDTANDELLDMDGVSAIMGRPVPTLRWWRAQGIGPRSFKLGRRVVYRRSDVNTWIEQQYAATASA